MIAVPEDLKEMRFGEDSEGNLVSIEVINNEESNEIQGLIPKNNQRFI